VTDLRCEDTPRAAIMRRDGLRAKLLRSHLAIALLGVGMLCIALATVMWTRSIGVRLAELDAPMAETSARTLVGLQRSLAGLRGWMALGGKSFRQERRRAWADEIEPSLERLEKLVRAAGDSEEVEIVSRVREHLQDLKEAQWWIEDVAQTPGNSPAQVIMIESAEPVGTTIETAITALLELQKKHQVGAEHEPALGRTADLRFAFALCRKSLRVLVFQGDAASRVRLRSNLDVVNGHIRRAVAHVDILTPEQERLLKRIRDEFAAYEMYCEEIIATPAHEWNVSHHLLATQAAPIAAAVTQALENMTNRHVFLMKDTSAQLVSTTNVGLALLVTMLLVMGATARHLSVRSARRITQPIALLARAAQDLSSGRSCENIPVVTPDELGDLTGAFNEMRRALLEREDALRESEGRMRAIVDTAADGIVTIDYKGTIESFNGAAETIFDYAESEVIGENVSLLMPSPHREEHDTYLQRYLETGTETILGGRREVVGRRKDGSTFPMDLCTCEARVGDHPIFTGMIRDITTRKKRDEGLLRLQAAIDTSADGIFLIDPQAMRFVDAGESACASVGYTRDELLAMGPHEIKPHITKEQLAAKFDELTSDGASVGVIETVHERKDGSHFPVEILLRFLERDGQQIVVAVARDITERKAADADLQRSRDEIEEANCALNDMIRDLETFNHLAVGRELFMIELKEEINDLLSQQDQPPKYEIVNNEVTA
jgi:PAS domain S-box-containing protein